jgi:hypothetical protein
MKRNYMSSMPAAFIVHPFCVKTTWIIGPACVRWPVTTPVVLLPTKGAADRVMADCYLNMKISAVERVGLANTYVPNAGENS